MTIIIITIITTIITYYIVIIVIFYYRFYLSWFLLFYFTTTTTTTTIRDNKRLLAQLKPLPDIIYPRQRREWRLGNRGPLGGKIATSSRSPAATHYSMCVYVYVWGAVACFLGRVPLTGGYSPWPILALATCHGGARKSGFGRTRQPAGPPSLGVNAA